MAIVGGGFVACEMAHVFSSLGVHVTQLQRSAALLVHEEEEISQRYTEIARHRYDVRLHTTIAGAERAAGVRRLATEGPAGRRTSRPRPSSSPSAAAPTPTSSTPPPEGWRRASTTCSSSTSSCGPPCRGVGPRRHLLDPPAQARRQPRGAHRRPQPRRRHRPPRRRPRVVDDRPVPHAVFGHPQVASFGPTAEQLTEAGTRFVTKTQAFGDVAYGWALEDTTGLLTVHAAPDGTILAAHALGPHASTIIQPLIQAASFGQNAIEVARGQYWIHPALAEVVENALLGLPLDH